VLLLGDGLILPNHMDVLNEVIDGNQKNSGS
jgi:hypothetical protein